MQSETNYQQSDFACLHDELKGLQSGLKGQPCELRLTHHRSWLTHDKSKLQPNTCSHQLNKQSIKPENIFIKASKQPVKTDAPCIKLSEQEIKFAKNFYQIAQQIAQTRSQIYQIAPHLY